MSTQNLVGTVVRLYNYPNASSTTGENRTCMTLAVETNPPAGAKNAEVRTEYLEVNLDSSEVAKAKVDDSYANPIAWKSTKVQVGDMVSVNVGLGKIRTFTRNDGTPGAVLSHNGFGLALRFKSKANATKAELALMAARKTASAKGASKARTLTARGATSAAKASAKPAPSARKAAKPAARSGKVPF